MKTILPVLLCYVLFASQMYAVDGGPVFTSNISPVGIYSGVIEGITETDDLTTSGPPIPGDPLPTPNNSSTTPSNALGLFNLSVPSVGSSTGTFVLFQDGVIFTGTIQAFADPNSDKLLGILEATYNFTLDTFDAAGDSVTSSVTASAVGQIDATITGATSSSTALGALKGTANLEISFGEVDATTLAPIIARTTTFNVIGVKQSAADTATSS
jgi:hypothetical protein